MFIVQLVLRLLCAALLTAASLAAVADTARADGCPKINGFIDFNCDGKIKITFAGDSIVKGVGDSLSPIVGYPGRLQSEWPWAEIHNIGIPGIISGRLLSKMKRYLSRGETDPAAAALRNADVIAITVGVNDFWVRTDVSVTVGNINKMVNYLASKLRNDDGVAPLIVVGTLLNTQRSYQSSFIVTLNRLLLQSDAARRFPVVFRFDRINVGGNAVLRPDKLHPTGIGYDRMKATVSNALLGRVQRLMSSLRTDKDRDGLYDQMEPTFGTNPKKLDTDGDTLADGDEVFIYGTDPTKRDTDGDGIDDNVEISSPTPTPTPAG
ncbi:MAG: SGNH/GDSL hydrolase family protein [Proteobacteria bacterium]|nr:SGNH/GDSL hydrolase family protein [Pseudomonadota bacterium]